MTDIVTDVSDASMASAIESNLQACFDFMASRSGGDVHDHGGITTVLTGLPGAGFNGVFSRLAADTPSDVLEARIASIVDYLKPRDLAFTWWVLPSTQPSELPRRLQAHGFQHSQDSPGMAAELDALNEAVATPAGLTIDEVADPDTLRIWTQTGLRGFGMVDAPEEAFYRVFVRLPYGPGTPSRLFLARLNGEPVATSVIFFGAGVAGIYNVATVSEHRGKGVGALVTLAALAEGRRQGYRIGILESSRMGFPLYQRLGFRQYITIAHYEWWPEATGVLGA